MSSRQVKDDDDCPMCEYLGKQIPGLCNILTGNEQECKELLAKIKSGEISPEEAFNDMFNELSTEQMGAITDWAEKLRDGIDAKTRAKKDHSQIDSTLK